MKKKTKLLHLCPLCGGPLVNFAVERLDFEIYASCSCATCDMQFFFNFEAYKNLHPFTLEKAEEEFFFRVSGDVRPGPYEEKFLQGFIGNLFKDKRNPRYVVSVFGIRPQGRGFCLLYEEAMTNRIIETSATSFFENFSLLRSVQNDKA